MMFRSLFSLGLLLLALSLGLLGLPENLASEPSKAETPRLIVLVYIDQLRGDYLTRWDSMFGEGGFHRLEKDGAWFQNCHYPYSDTVTAAGHASVATGCSPRTHGIIGNEWYDRSAGASAYCVSSERYRRVPPAALRGETEKDKKKAKGVSPERLLAPTIGDALKQATGGKGRVVSLSLKDRSAVLPAGQRPDACYWLELSTGQFVTSTYYRDALHSWVANFNRSGVIDAWMGKNWTRVRERVDYEKNSGPDDAAGEGTPLFARTFPHALGSLGGLNVKAAYYGALYNSPFGNDVLLALARRAIEAEQLGKHDQPDLLCVSFSSNDAIGHCWGPDSQEVLDVTLRTDIIVRELLVTLDRQVGKGHYLLVLTADHGVCPLPEATRRRGDAALRINTTTLLKKAGVHLSATFHVPAEDNRWLETNGAPWLYLNRALLARRHLKQSEVEAALAGWLARQPGILRAYTRSQLLAGIPAEDAIGQKVLRSFFPERSGDVCLIVKPNYLLTTWLTGTNHGTPHAYDTHVPLLVYGAGVRPGVRREAVTPLAAAGILARAIGIKPPAKAAVEVPADLFLPR
ncbi:MAG TPA: alkaline phosphatase family protein [Gemmataceae bacterium]|nr:alkaline phosphatase family protein [Gemmataceae bacterium]